MMRWRSHTFAVYVRAPALCGRMWSRYRRGGLFRWRPVIISTQFRPPLQSVVLGVSVHLSIPGTQKLYKLWAMACYDNITQRPSISVPNTNELISNSWYIQLECFHAVVSAQMYCVCVRAAARVNTRIECRKTYRKYMQIENILVSDTREIRFSLSLFVSFVALSVSLL